jgi:hypothetical protein
VILYLLHKILPCVVCFLVWLVKLSYRHIQCYVQRMISDVNLVVVWLNGWCVFILLKSDRLRMLHFAPVSSWNLILVFPTVLFSHHESLLSLSLYSVPKSCCNGVKHHFLRVRWLWMNRKMIGEVIYIRVSDRK